MDVVSARERCAFARFIVPQWSEKFPGIRRGWPPETPHYPLLHADCSSNSVDDIRVRHIGVLE
jgi:hypothetical protein